MFLISEIYNRKESNYTTCLLGEHSSQFTRSVGTFRSMLQHCKNSQETKKLLLLDEQRFSWFATPVAFCAIKPCTVQDMYDIIDPILQKYWGHNSEKLFYHIDGISVDGVESDYYIGKQWDIRCVVHVIALRRDDRYMAKSVLGNAIDSVSIYPASFFTLHHIKQTLHKQDGTVLYIWQHYTKRVVFENGMYKTCEVLDLWWQVLKDIYEENNIREFFDSKKGTLETNAYAKDLVDQSVRFYVDMLMRWLRSYRIEGNVFLVSDIVHNEYFMETFASMYQQYTQWFVVPISHVQWLKTYGRNWQEEDLDIQTAAHYFI